MVRKRIKLAQNFLKDPHLVALLVKDSSISSDDVVLEIGPGEGIITNELAKVAWEVIAVEQDAVLADKLSKRWLNNSHVRVFKADFLRFKVDEAVYKIFSNIPFNRTADIVKGILSSENVSEAYLIIQKEAAEKYSGTPIETKISILAKPWFSFEIAHQFERTDFEPIPSVDVVLLHIQRRNDPLVPKDEAKLFDKFVNYGFHSTKDNLSLAFNKIFTYTQWKRLARDLKFPIKVKPTELKIQQWLGLFSYFLKGVTEEKKSPIKTYY